MPFCSERMIEEWMDFECRIILFMVLSFSLIIASLLYLLQVRILNLLCARCALIFNSYCSPSWTCCSWFHFEDKNPRFLTSHSHCPGVAQLLCILPSVHFVNNKITPSPRIRAELTVILRYIISLPCYVTNPCMLNFVLFFFSLVLKIASTSVHV